MIQYANQLASEAYKQTGTMPADADGFKYPIYDLTNPKDALKANILTGYVSNLDVARDLAKQFGTFSPAPKDH